MKQIAIEDFPELSERSVPILIHTAVPIERKNVLAITKPFSNFDDICKISWDSTTYYLGHIGLYDICLVQSVCGSDTRGGSVDEVGLAIERWKPNLVMSVGIAFGKELDSDGNRTKQILGDVLVSSLIIPYHHVKLLPDGSEEDRAARPEASAILFNRIQHCDWSWTPRRGSRSRSPILGPLLSGPYLYNNPKEIKKIFKKYPTAIGGEMEGVGIYSACGKRRVEWIVVKGVCDWGKKKNDRYQPIAARNAVSLISQILNESGLTIESSEIEQRSLAAKVRIKSEQYRDKVETMWTKSCSQQLTHTELVKLARDLHLHARFQTVWLRYGMTMDYCDSSFHCNAGHISLLSISEDRVKEEQDSISGTIPLDDDLLDIRVTHDSTRVITAKVNSIESTSKIKMLVFCIHPSLEPGCFLEFNYEFHWPGHDKDVATRWHEFCVDVPMLEVFLRINAENVKFTSIFAIFNSETRICSNYEYEVTLDQNGFLVTIRKPKLFNTYRINFDLL